MASSTSKKCHILRRERSEINAPGSHGSRLTRDSAGATLSFFQVNESVCVVSSLLNDTIEWSSAIPGTFRDAGLTKSGTTVAVSQDDKILVSDLSETISLNYIGLPITSPTSPFKPSMISFHPLNANQVVVSGGRDIRILDLVRSTPEVAKCVMTVSGVAAQAIPTSFCFLNDSPNVIATGWELPSSSYVRLLDLREGSSKSVRIWKTKNVNGISSSVSDSNLLGSYSDSRVCVWDVRVSKEDDALSFDTTDPVSLIQWSAVKRLTMGVMTEKKHVAIRRLDVGRFENIDCQDAGSFVFSSGNDVAVMRSTDGKVVACKTRQDWIPLMKPRSGELLSVSRNAIVECSNLTGGDSALITSVIELSQLMDSDSLVDALHRFDARNDVSFAFSDKVNLHSIQDPLHITCSDREYLLEILLSPNQRSLVIALLQGNVNEAIRESLHDEDPRLTRILSGTLVGVPVEIEDTNFKISEELRSALQLAHSQFSSEVVRERSDLNIFVRAAWAALHEPSEEALAELLKNLTLEAVKSSSSLRTIALIGLKDTEIVKRVITRYLDVYDGDRSMKILDVALVGLLVGAANQIPFKKYIDFIRNDVCNRIGGDCWRLRSVIDSMTNEAPSGGSARLVCYYCNKLLTGAESNRCPHRGCHKPLPSCCICLEPLRLSDWTVWCATCRHGGHKTHLDDWFRLNDECPVAGCNCQCGNIDGL